MTIEVVVYTIESALKAQEGRADRIELCSNPAEGGATPSYGLIEVVRKHIDMDVYVMIRPRGGDFLYTSYEFYAMKKDIAQCQRLSVDGIVFGILQPDGRLDKKRCAELIAKARPLKVTCHRAFDMTRDPFEALEDCIEVGFDRILTSGREEKAINGIHLIAALNSRAKDRIMIMPGAGIKEENIKEIVSKTRVQEVHFSATRSALSLMEYSNPKIDGLGGGLNVVDPDRIKNMRQLAENA